MGMGYNLKNATVPECFAAESGGMSKGRLMDITSANCIETIADEAKGTAAFWTRGILTDPSGKKFTTNFAERLKIVDGKIAAYHIDFDSYNFLSQDGSVALAADFTAASGMVTAAVAVGVVVAVIVASLT